MARDKRSKAIDAANRLTFDAFLGSRLREHRDRNGMTIDQLAATIGVNGRDIARFESGQKRLSAQLLFSLAKFLNVQVSDFFIPASVQP